MCILFNRQRQRVLLNSTTQYVSVCTTIFRHGCTWFKTKWNACKILYIHAWRWSFRPKHVALEFNKSIVFDCKKIMYLLLLVYGRQGDEFGFPAAVKIPKAFFYTYRQSVPLLWNSTGMVAQFIVHYKGRIPVGLHCVVMQQTRCYTVERATEYNSCATSCYRQLTWHLTNATYISSILKGLVRSPQLV